MNKNNELYEKVRELLKNKVIDGSDTHMFLSLTTNNGMFNMKYNIEGEEIGLINMLSMFCEKNPDFAQILIRVALPISLQSQQN